MIFFPTLRRKQPPPPSSSPLPSPRAPPPPAQKSRPSLPRSPTFTENVLQGFAFGTGTSLSKELVRRLMEDSTESKKKSVCQHMQDELRQCLETGFHCDPLMEKYIQVCTASATPSTPNSTTTA